MINKTIAFLYIHGIHHIYHTIITAVELSLLRRDYRILLFVSTQKHKKIVEDVLLTYKNHACRIILLKPTFRYKYLNFKKKQYPYPRAMFKKALPYLKKVDAIVTTTHIGKKYALRYKLTKQKIIYQYHGCGDGQYGFEKKMGEFDFVLLPGLYHQKRLNGEGVMQKEKTEIVGWPKLDILLRAGRDTGTFFHNDKPIILYNPHWNPVIGSFGEWGKAVLDFFYKQEDYNCIFAPHILLEHYHTHYRYDINLDKYKEKENIHIDLGSLNCIDMTYLKIANAYIGDVSSQVYEWIAYKPRPCIFLNTHGLLWKNDINYNFWNYGPVVENVEDLEKCIIDAFSESEYISIQKENIGEYIDITNEISSKRAAKAIIKACEEGLDK